MVKSNVIFVGDGKPTELVPWVFTREEINGKSQTQGASSLGFCQT
jgi:hypothetical protein